MKAILNSLLIICAVYSCQSSSEQYKLRNKNEIAKAIDIVIDSVFNDTTFVKQIELAPRFSDRIADTVLHISLPYFNLLSEQDVDYIIWQKKELKDSLLSHYVPGKASMIKDNFSPNSQNMYFELGAPLFSISGDFFLIHIVIVLQENNRTKWDATVFTFEKKNGNWSLIGRYDSPLRYNITERKYKTDKYPNLPGY